MSIIEKFSTISDTMGDLFNFVQSDNDLAEDFSEYQKTLAINNPSQKVLDALLLTYVFERRIDNHSVIELFEAKNSNYDKNILKALNSTISGYFSVEKINKNGFIFNNLLNEKSYDVVSLVKMHNFKGVYAGQYVKARIFTYDNVCYLLEISDTYSQYAKNEIFRFLIAKIIQEPESAYLDNTKKELEIMEHVKKTVDLFSRIFNSNEIITTNAKTDMILNLINDCFDEKYDTNSICASDYIEVPQAYKFFKVSEFTSDYDNFLENSLDGFSSHKENYDVGILVDKDLGLYILPFWGTINEIFQNSKNSIEGANECIKYYIENEKIPLFVLEILNKRYSNFMEIVNTIYDSNRTFDDIVSIYKQIYTQQKIYSLTSVLYSSRVFLETMGFLEEKVDKSLPNIDFKNVGRNDLCPCGSGKKYKNCCLNK